MDIHVSGPTHRAGTGEFIDEVLQIIGGGRFMGYALRMDSLSFQSLEAYELCWARHRDLHAH